MTGPEHYKRAEQILAGVDKGFTHDDGTAVIGPEPEMLAAAQVHATLALAAATAELDAYGMADGSATGRLERRGKAWGGVLDGGKSS